MEKNMMDLNRDFTEQQFEKLPKWARRHIMLLERRVRDAENMLDSLVSNTNESDLSWTRGMDKDNFLPEYTRVTFHFPQLHGRAHKNFMWRDGVVDVNASGPLLFQPRASNAGYMTLGHATDVIPHQQEVWKHEDINK
jgi:hypothetical protein